MSSRRSRAGRGGARAAAEPAPAAARRCAVLVCLATPALSLYAVRIYAETLATALAARVVALQLRLRAWPVTAAVSPDAIALGLAVGAALLAKQPAVFLPVLLAVGAALLAKQPAANARGRAPC